MPVSLSTQQVTPPDRWQHSPAHRRVIPRRLVNHVVRRRHPRVQAAPQIAALLRDAGITHRYARVPEEMLFATASGHAAGETVYSYRSAAALPMKISGP
jgi:hypothetical protein